MRHDRLPVRGVTDHQIVVGGGAINIEVVDQPAVVVRQHRVLASPRFEGGGVVERSEAQKLERPRPRNAHLTHMADVEHPGALAHRQMLLMNSRLVLNRHLPTGKIDHAPARRQVQFI